MSIDNYVTEAKKTAYNTIKDYVIKPFTEMLFPQYEEKEHIYEVMRLYE